MIQKLRFTPIAIFLFNAVIFGLIMVFLVPPFQSPDENSHFYRVQHMAEGNLMAIKTDSARLGGDLPLALQAYADSFQYLRNDYGACIDITQYRSYSKLNQSKEYGFTDFANVGYYAPTAYLHIAMCTALVSCFTSSIPFQFYASRIASLFLWIVIIVLALREARSIQWLILVLALLPSSIVLHSSISADTITNGLCFYMVAMIMSRVLEPDKIWTDKSLLILLILAIIIMVNKVVYSPLILLCLLVPQHKFSTTWNKTRFLVSAFVVLLVTVLLWYFIAGNTFIPYDLYHVDYRDSQQLNPGVDPKAQLSFVFHHPLDFLSILIQSYSDSALATTAHYLGKFGWEHNYLPIPVLILLIFQIILATIGTELGKDETVSWKQRISVLLISLITVFSLSLVLYMQWSPVGYGQILSLSGRYFIPIVPVICLAFIGLVGKKLRVRLDLLVALISVGVLITTGIQIYLRYWC